MPEGSSSRCRGSGSTGVIPSYFGSHRPLARARLVQWMNENHMKTSVTTGEVSLRWAKKADQRAKSSENGPISPNCYLLGLRRRLDYGPRRQKYHENAGNNHLKTVNIRSNGKSRLNQHADGQLPGSRKGYARLGGGSIHFKMGWSLNRRNTLTISGILPTFNPRTCQLFGSLNKDFFFMKNTCPASLQSLLVAFIFVVECPFRPIRPEARLRRGRRRSTRCRARSRSISPAISRLSLADFFH